METLHRLRVTLNVGRYDYPLLLVRGYGVYDGLSGAPTLFVSPNPTLPTLLGLLQAYAQSQQVMSDPTKAMTATRNLRASELLSGLESERSYLQVLCDASPEQASMLIRAAGMFEAQPPVHSKAFLQAQQSQPGAPVHLIANVGLLTRETKGRVAWNWEFSSDFGKTWLSAPSTPHGDTFIAGLTPLTTYVFRASVTTRTGGQGAWSDVVTFEVR
jgi:hypothetical protein